MLRRRRSSGDGGRLAVCRSSCGIVLLIVLTLAAAHLAPATASPVPLPPPEPVASPTPLPVPTLDQGELARSIERAVARILEEGRDPCAQAKRENKPCFPTAVDREGPRVSVSEDFKKWRPLAQGSNQRTLRRLVSPTGTVTGAVGFDPVCLGRLLVRGFKGKNITYYLYRAPDPAGERAVLRENEIPATAGPTNPESAYVLVRKVTGECEAIAAYDALNREIRERNREKTGKADHRALRLAGPPAP